MHINIYSQQGQNEQQPCIKRILALSNFRVWKIQSWRRVQNTTSLQVLRHKRHRTWLASQSNYTAGNHSCPHTLMGFNPSFPSPSLASKGLNPVEAHEEDRTNYPATYLCQVPRCCVCGTMTNAAEYLDPGRDMIGRLRVFFFSPLNVTDTNTFKQHFTKHERKRKRTYRLWV